MSEFNFAPVSPLSATLEQDDYLLSQRLLKVLNSSSPGYNNVEQWETAFSEWLGVTTSTAWAGGRAALYAAVKTLELKPGDEVIVPAFTCQAVINAFEYQYVKPVYADIEDQTYGLDIQSVKKVRSNKTKAIMLQYTFGLVSRDTYELINWARQNKIWIIEDCAHSLGATSQDQKLGTLGDIAVFSSERSKIINTVHGGMCSTSNPVLSERLNSLKKNSPQVSLDKSRRLIQTLISLYEEKQGLQVSFSQEQTLPQMFPEEFQGQFVPHYAETMSAPVAAIALNQFAKLDHFQKQRDRAVAFWNAWCDSHQIEKPIVIKDSRPTFLRYPVYVGAQNKQNLYQYTELLNVEPGVWFTSAAHPTPVDLPDCPVGMEMAAGCINMPTILPESFYEHFHSN